MKKEKWIWMPHAGHFICGNDCRFVLNTYVGKYIASTVGELWADSRVREIKADCRKIKIVGMGDSWDADYMKKIGFDEIGFGRMYETMVFHARRADKEDGCCPWRMKSGHELDFKGYNDAEEARKGHQKLCEKWSKK